MENRENIAPVASGAPAAAPASGTQAAAGRRTPVLLALGVALLTALVYLPALKNGFVEWDDPLYLLDNLRIRSFDVSLFSWAFTDYHAGNWHPLTWISHALDYAVWGLNPLGHHLTSVALHAANTFLVVLVGRQLLQAGEERSARTPDARPPDQTRVWIAAAVTGLLFGVHPLHVESVAWVSERKDLLCALFFLLSVRSYLSRAGRPAAQRGGGNSPLYAPLAFFALALLSKPMAVSLPLVLLILDWYPLRRLETGASLRPVLLEKLPFLALSLASSIVTIFAQQSGNAMTLMATVPFSARLLVATQSFFLYLWKMALPTGLSPFYPYPLPQQITLFAPQYFVPLALAAGVAALLGTRRGIGRPWLAAGGYSAVTLLPVLGIVQVGGQAMADRYSYLPSLGPFLLLGILAARAWSRAGSNRALRLAAAASLAVPVALLCFLTLRQIPVWKNGVDFWSYVLTREPGGFPRAYSGRGTAYENKGEFDRALADFDAAINLDPDNGEAYASRGLVKSRKGYPDAALLDYDAALKLKIPPETAYRVYVNRGIAFGSKGMFNQAVEDFNAAIALKPESGEAYVNRGRARDQIGQGEGALQDYDAAQRLDCTPDSLYQVYLNRGALFGRQGAAERALADFNAAVALKPESFEAYGNRGITYGGMGREEAALQDYSKALALNAEFLPAYLNRGDLYARGGQRELAARDYQAACSKGSGEGCQKAGLLRK